MNDVIDDREIKETVSTTTTTIEDNVCIYIISLFYTNIFEYELSDYNII